MAYDLGIDIGTSFTAAAIRRDDGVVSVVGLGAIADSIPTVVYLNEDGSMVVGDAANRRALLDAYGVAREFKRRLGDPTPLILRGSPFSAEALIARMLRHVVERVADREREAPRRLVITHPANWGRFRLEIFQQATEMAGLEHAELVSEPVAAAVAFASANQLSEGAAIAVYDLGGGTFDAAVVRRSRGGFELLGDPVGLEHVGGIDFDAAVVDFVRSSLTRDSSLDPDNPEHVTAMAHLRRACVTAKETLSIDSETSIPVLLPGFDDAVTMQRAEFESRISPLVSSSVASLERAISQAKLTPDDLTSILIVGGSSRVPLVQQMLVDRFGDLIALSADPVHAIARGAALIGGITLDQSPSSLAPSSPMAVPGTDHGERTVPPSPPLGPPSGDHTRPPDPPKPQQPAPIDPEPAATLPPNAPSPVPSGVQPVEGQMAPHSQLASTDDDATTPEGSNAVRQRQPWRIGAVAAALLLAAVAAYSLTRDDSVDDASKIESTGSEPGQEVSDEPEVAAAQSVVASSAPADGMVEIPAGAYPLGLAEPESNTSESLSQSVDMTPFFIDALEVTNTDYRAFIDQTGAEPPASWPRGIFPEEAADHPVEGVSFEWAQAFCTSTSKRLPTEREWEVAARGVDGRIWPWGDDPGAVTLPATGTYPVGTMSGNVSPFGVFDLAGNVWEWVADSYDKRVSDNFRVLRGGQNGFLRETVTRLPVDPLHSSALQTAGFRCAADGVDPTAQPGTFGSYDAPEGTNEPLTVELPDGVEVYDDFTDATSGWSEMSVDGEFRLGYHPNEYLHLETRSPFKEALTLGPWRANPDEGFALRTTAFVEPSLTTDGGTFAFGLAFSFDDSGRGLVFMVDERASTWTLASREVTGDGPYSDKGAEYVTIEQGTRPIPAEVTLEVLDLGNDDYEVRINGAAMHTRNIPGYDGTAAGLVLISFDQSEKVHIHFDEFQVNELG